MGMWGVDSDEFRAFKADVARRLEILDGLIRSKVTDSEELARVSANSAAAHEESARKAASELKAALSTLDAHLKQAQGEVEGAKAQRESATNANKTLQKIISKAQEQEAALTSIKGGFEASSAEMRAKLGDALKLLDEAKALPTAVVEAQKALIEAKGNVDSIAKVLAHVATKKGEVDDLYHEVFGLEVAGSDGKVSHVDGLKDQLDKSYKELAERAAGLKSEIKDLVNELGGEYTTVFASKEGELRDILSDAKSQYGAISDQLKSLLPGAMAAGLSAAYEAKVSEEKASLVRFDNSFRFAIGGMIAVSLIPFAVDVYLIAWMKRELVEVIKETPTLILSILPLYFPILWIAFSASKKVNLSKRLIEEYTHKAVLGRTFSGLSNQIDTLPHESAIKEDLRTRLLFTVLQVSAENPGKLITNYKQSDHPLMEALENSAKLSDAVASLARIPGLGPLAKKLTEKSDAVLQEMEKKVEHGLSITEALQKSTG